MNVTVNDQTVQLEEGQTVADLIREMGLQGRPVAAELNRRLVAKREHAQTELSDGDHLELVTLVGGG